MRASVSQRSKNAFSTGPSAEHALAGAAVFSLEAAILDALVWPTYFPA